LGTKLVVAVSGGADSVCLLHILAQWQSRLRLKLHIAHINHQLRGEESATDAAYVSDLTYKLGIPATIEGHNVKAYQQQKQLSLEEAAREVRYSFLARVAESIGAKYIAVGHTRDDHIETILMHIVRGTGMAGLQGLQHSTTLQLADKKTNLKLIRPLITVSRKDTKNYCNHFQLSERSDSSNVSHYFFRNRIRQELLPIMRSYNQGIDASLIRLADIASSDVSFIEQHVSRLWKQVADVNNNAIYLNTEKLSKLHLSLQRQILRKAIEQLSGNLKDFEADHINTMIDFLTRPAGKSLHLPRGLRLVKEYGRMVLTTGNTSLCPLPELEDVFNIKVPGETISSGWHVKTDIVAGSIKDVDLNGYKACFDLNKTGTQLKVRKRKQGDRFQPLGIHFAKKLQDFMVDAKIPRTWRSRVPLLCSPSQIIWVVGWQIDDRVKVTAETSQILNITFVRVAC